MTENAQDLTVASVLGFLARAGRDGATTTQIAQAFSHPESYHQRSNRVSQIMIQLAGEGCAELAGTERSPLRRGGEVRRWHITRAGIFRHEAAARQRRRAEELAASTRAAVTARQAALDAVRDTLAALARAKAPVPHCWRTLTVLQLRTVPCSLSEIADLFALTPERIRQIEAGQGGSCRCPQCSRLAAGELTAVPG
jgi:hypothetical protein